MPCEEGEPLVELPGARISDDGKWYICCINELCRSAFLTLTGFRGHAKTHDPNAESQQHFNCSSCQKTYSSKTGYEKHVAYSHSQKEYFCPEPCCEGKAYRSKQSLSAHRLRFHGQKKKRGGESAGLLPHACSVVGCNRRFSRLGNKKRHEELTHGLTRALEERTDESSEGLGQFGAVDGNDSSPASPRHSIEKRPLELNVIDDARSDPPLTSLKRLKRPTESTEEQEEVSIVRGAPQSVIDSRQVHVPAVETTREGVSTLQQRERIQPPIPPPRVVPVLQQPAAISAVVVRSGDMRFTEDDDDDESSRISSWGSRGSLSARSTDAADSVFTVPVGMYPLFLEPIRTSAPSPVVASSAAVDHNMAAVDDAGALSLAFRNFWMSQLRYQQ